MHTPYLALCESVTLVGCTCLHCVIYGTRCLPMLKTKWRMHMQPRLRSTSKAITSSMYSAEELVCTYLVCEFRSLAVCSVHTVAIPLWRKWRLSLGLMGLSSMVSGGASTHEGLATPFLSPRCILLSCASTCAWLFALSELLTACMCKVCSEALEGTVILTSLFCHLFNHMLAHLFVLCLLLRPGMYSAIERPVMLPFLTLYTVILVI